MLKQYSVMKKLINLSFIILLLIFNSCDKSESDTGESGLISTESGGIPVQAGVITAGEWNDLDNWDFWIDLLSKEEYSQMPSYWDFYTNNRFSFLIKDNGSPVINANVELIKGSSVIWSAKTDNFGKVDLWAGLFQKEGSPDLSLFSLRINNVIQSQSLNAYENGVNEININSNANNLNKVEISFIVDATGSMGDEIQFLKADLENVIDSVKNLNSNLDIFTSAVFYRDKWDSYLIRKSEFTNDLSITTDFISQQNANGGGDFPEAVDTALNVCVNQLQWSDNARTRIAFLILDAPPHYTADIVENIHNTIENAAQKGIKIIPITASGIDKETEFLMRFMAISTNGTYVFITDDSGVGNEHLKASVGEFQVEYLNNLMVRLINKYSE